MPLRSFGADLIAPDNSHNGAKHRQDEKSQRMNFFIVKKI